MTLSRGYLFNTLLALLVTVSSSWLYAVGEARFDVYISMYTLSYLVLKTVLRPRTVSRDYLGIGLFIVFLYFVSVRVYEVLIGH